LAEQAISKFRAKGRGGSVARGASPVPQRQNPGFFGGPRFDLAPENDF